MGCSVSKDSAEGRARSNTNREIDTALHDDWMHTNDTVQLLLIGSPGSGKTTLFETVKHGHGLKLTEKQRREHVYYIHCALVHAMKVLITQGETLDILPSERAANREIDLIKNVDEKEGINVATLEALQTLWADTVIQDVWKERYEFQINDSVAHLFRRIDRMKAPDYLPDDADIEFSQARITGVITETYKIRGSYFQISDVSGQRRTTRRKWIHCFEEVSAIVFVAALSDYDEVLEGDRRMNKLVDTLNFFQEICNTIYFIETPIILILNKSDLFREKIATSNIRDIRAFHDFKGKDGDYDDGVAYILHKFKVRDAMSATNRRLLYHTVTNCAETNVAGFVYHSCKDILLREHARIGDFDTGR